MDDYGYQLQSSAMIVPKTLQGYVSGSQIFGEHGDPWGYGPARAVPHEGSRPAAERRVDLRAQESCRLYRLSNAGRRQRSPLHINLEMNF